MRCIPAIWLLAAAVSAAACGRDTPPGLPLGAAAPDFSLPGADGRTHALADYREAKVLALVFTSNTCPASQLYEARIQALFQQFRDRGAAVVAVNANRPDAVRLEDLAYSDVGDALEDMTIRAAHRGLGYPYLADGEAQALTRQAGIVSVPHVMVFDQDRALRYSGRIDDDPRGAQVSSHDARDAIEGLLGGGRVPAGRPSAAACPVKGLSEAGPDARLAAFESDPVPLEMAGAEDLRRLRQNPTGKLLLVNFWATWCIPCAREFPELESTYRRFHARGLEYVTISVNDPEERDAVLAFLQSYRASHDNRLFATSDVYGLQEAFDPNMPAPVPFTLLLAPNGDVLYQHLGELDAPALRRAILASLPDDPEHPGLQAYWSGP